jgi:hypothetical protein
MPVKGGNGRRYEFSIRQKYKKTAAFSACLRAEVRFGPDALAERVGFEPTVRFPAHTLSKRAP